MEHAAKPNVSIYRLISYSLVSCMMACIVATILRSLNQVNATWQPTYLIGLSFIGAFNCLYSYHRSCNLTVFSQKWLEFYGAQALLLLMLTKITVGLSHGMTAFLAEIPRWQQNFIVHFFDGETAFALVMLLLIWIISDNFASILEEIGPDHIQNISIGVSNETKDIPPRQRLIDNFFWLGAFQIVLTLLGRIDVNAIFFDPAQLHVEAPILAGGGASTLLYFVLGLILLSQTQFVSLSLGWYAQKIPVNASLARQWATYSLLFVGLVILIVSLLPTPQNTMQPSLAIPRYTSQASFSTPRPMPTQPPPMIPSRPSENIDAPITFNLVWLLESLRRIITWVIVLSIVILSVRHYLRNAQELIEKMRRLPGWRILVPFLSWLQSLLNSIKNSLINLVEIGRERTRQLIPGQIPGIGFIHLRKLTPRQKIYFFYLAFIRRAGEKGLPRSSAQTPDEYAASLQSALPAATADIQALTEAFVSARYSRQPVEAEQSQRVESIWQRVRKALKGKQ